MSLQEKYSPLMSLGQELGAKDVRVEEKDGKLYVSATVKSPTEKNKLWDKIKEIGGNEPADLRADIKTETNEPTERKYTVQAGDTLSAISKEYYGDPNQYNKIFEANKDILSDPDKIQPGQDLIIPN